MSYRVMASGQSGVIGLQRETIQGAVKKAGELRRDGYYTEVRIIDADTGDAVDEGTVAESPRPTVS